MATRSGTNTGLRAAFDRIPIRVALVFLAVLAVVIAAVTYVALRDGGPSTRTYSGRFGNERVNLAGTDFAGRFEWRVDGGTFTASNGSAAATRSSAGPAFATVLPPSPLQSVVGVYGRVSSTSGLVFRYANGGNYWSVTAVPEYGTWNINKTVNGQTSFVANTGNNLTLDKGSVEVQFAATTFTVVINGKPSMRVTDGALGTARRVGFVAGPNDPGDSRWEELRVTAE